MKVLIDADYYLYRAACAAEYEAELTPDVWTYLCRITDAKNHFNDEMDRFQAICPDHELMLILGDAVNFRYAVYRDYKSNRQKQRRPAGYKALRKWASATWPTLTLANVEGDDILGVMAQEGDVIVSADKDLKTIPGLHLDGEAVVEVGEWQADVNFYTQILTGDTSDGYPGCKGVGPVKAAQLLAGCNTTQELWLAVIQAYAKAGLDINFALQMARCARILRPGEYDHDKQRAILWNPPCDQ